MKKLKLIIFDCDGVLVDSERITTEVFAKVLEDYCGISLDLEELLDKFMGQSSQNCLNIIEKLMGEKPPSDLEFRYQNAITTALSASVTCINGVEKALSDISLPYCVASGGSHDKMRITLGKAGLLPYFEGKLFSTEEVSRRKPDPDIYLYAARKMGCIDPSKCLVVEDSPLGVEGGVAAGMVVFGYSDLIKKHKLIASGAHHVFDDMANLVNEIKIYEQKAL